jgi:hypothetical protein
MGGICDTYRGFGWTSREVLTGEMGGVGGRGCCCDEGIGGHNQIAMDGQSEAADRSGNGGWLGSGGMKKSGTTGAVLLEVLGRWFFELHPLDLSSASCKAGVCNLGRCKIIHNHRCHTFLGRWLLGIGWQEQNWWELLDRRCAGKELWKGERCSETFKLTSPFAIGWCCSLRPGN